MINEQVAISKKQRNNNLNTKYNTFKRKKKLKINI